jgi:hypothetical protein
VTVAWRKKVKETASVAPPATAPARVAPSSRPTARTSRCSQRTASAAQIALIRWTRNASSPTGSSDASLPATQNSGIPVGCGDPSRTAAAPSSDESSQ